MNMSKALVGRKAILKYLDIGKRFFYTLVDEGLPVRRVGKGPNSHLVAHKDELDEWCKAYPDKLNEPK